MNFFQAINNALSTALATDETAGMCDDHNEHYTVGTDPSPLN
jgi:hypothetical protein